MPIYVPDPPDLVGRVRQLRRETERMLAEEAGEIVETAQDLSQPGSNFQASWSNKTTPRGAAVVNDAERQGRHYGAFVHHAGETTTINEQVGEHVADRTRDLAERLAARGAEILTGG